jgi:hypothetical protein
LTPGGGELTVERSFFGARRAKSAIFRLGGLARTLMFHANVKTASFIAAAAAATTVGLTAPPARAADGPLLGFSVDGYVSPTWDRSVTNTQNGQAHNPTRSAAGLATLFNVDELVLGGIVDGMPGILGDGRLSVGGVFGWQPRSGEDRYQVLGEIGEERFSDVGGNLLATPSVDETTLGYVGARLGMTHTLTADGRFELGVWAFVRKDVGEAVVSNTSGSFGGEDTVTQYRLGGYSGGVSLRVGLRFDQKRAAEPTGTELSKT